LIQSHDKRIDDIFKATLDLPVAERDDYLIEACDGDSAVRLEVLALLDAAKISDTDSDEQWSAARDRLLADAFAIQENDSEDLSGNTVGHWKIRKRLARGGLATVYIADRIDGEFQQKAALKVLRRGLDTDDLIARFRAEREILSTLDHPSIARIHDGGALDDGRPYLVLEFINGESITAYCTSRNLGVKEKVRLIIEVLRALHHAHKHLIVHRDVKPSNILVTQDGNVSLLDFGIAKILDPTTMPGASTATRTGVSLLTPGYGSPEQHAGETITTASDIYQSGLVLFELLSGTRPFAGNKDRDYERKLEPSQHLRDASERKKVRGDLDAIVTKATHGDPSRRYDSAENMAADLSRFLDGMPVQAQPDSFLYRFSRFTKRRPWVAPVATLIVLATVGYLATITVYTKRLAEEEQLAVASQRFLTDLFRSSDPFNPADSVFGSDITVLQALELGRERIENELVNEPKLKASLLASISDVFGSLDRQEDAMVLREEALAIEQEFYGATSPQVVLSLRALGGLYRNSGQTEQAAASIQQQLSIAQDIYATNSPELGLAEIAAGIDAYSAGDLSGSRDLLASGIAKLRLDFEEHASIMINALIVYATNLGSDLSEEAFVAIGEAQEIAQTSYGEGSLPLATTQVRLASTLTLFSNWEESERNFNKALPVLEERLGVDHSTTVSALNNFAFMYSQKGDSAHAEAMFEELLERQRRIFGPKSRVVADASQNLGALYSARGRYNDAVDALEVAYENYKLLLNDDNYVIAYPLLTIAYANIQLGHATEAQSAAEEALRRFRATRPDTHLEGVARCLVGVALERQGSVDDGGQMISESHELLGKGNIPAHYHELCRYAK